MTTTAPRSLTVVMPAYNAPHYLRVTLPPLARMLADGEIDELLVVDDCSTDDTVEVAKSFGARILKTPRNMGPGGARNLAVEEAKGEIVWFVDADVVAKPGSAALIRKAFADPQVAAIFGAYDDKPPVQNFWSQYKNLVHRYYHDKSGGDAETFWAGCGAVDRDAYRAIGGFDVINYKRPSIEDIDLGYRLRDAGWRILLEPRLQATHLKHWTFTGVVHTDIFCRAVPWSRLLAKRGKTGTELNISNAERIRAGIAGLLLLSFAAPLAGPAFWAAPAVMALIAIAANFGLFAFMAKVRGPLFALACLGFHQIYYLYSTAAFVFCKLEHALKLAPRSAALEGSAS